MKSLSSVGVGLSVVFACLFAALIAELYYLLWWKKRLTSNGSEIESRDYTSPARELFFTLCWRKPRICSVTTTRLQNDNDNFLFKPFDGDDCLYPPRFLFTIVEETREELESEDGKSRNRSLSDLLVSLETTPYLTPLASPPFFTPSLTPLQLDNGHISRFNFRFDSEDTVNAMDSSSPPPKLRFLQDAEEKLKKKNEDEGDESLITGLDDEEESFITITVDQHNSSACSQQLLPLSSSSSVFR